MKKKIRFIPVDENKLVYSYSRHSRALDNADYDPTIGFRKKPKKKLSIKARKLKRSNKQKRNHDKQNSKDRS